MTYRLVALGGTCYVTTTDEKTVLKGYQVWRDGKKYIARDECEDDILREAAIYEHLGDHPNILKYFGLEEHCPGVHSIRLELAPLGCVRKFITDHANEPPPIRVRLQMAADVAAGVAHMLAKGVQHCDMSCRNLFLFEGFRVKLGDFGASLLEGRDFKTTFCEEPEYELPLRGRKFDERPPVKRELFALGSAIYEITTWERPCPGLEYDEILKKFEREEFPSLEGNPAAAVIDKCWKEEFESADAALEELTRCIESITSQELN